MFENRVDAGHRLAARIRELDEGLVDPLVLGIPRGGVVVAAVVADDLGADLDVVLTHKLRAPGQPELAVGAIDETGRTYLGPLADQVDRAALEEEARVQLEAIRRRTAALRRVRPIESPTGRAVVVVDDGIATGSTMIAALRTVAAKRPRLVVAAVPIATPAAVETLRRECDAVVCVHADAGLRSVSQFYEQFEEVSDDRVVGLLHAAAAAGGPQT